MKDYLYQLAINVLWKLGFEETSFKLYLRDINRKRDRHGYVVLNLDKKQSDYYEACEKEIKINVIPPKQPTIN